MSKEKNMKEKIKQFEDEKILLNMKVDEKEINELLNKTLGLIAHQAQETADKKFSGHPGSTVMFMDAYLNNFILNLLARANQLQSTYATHCADIIHSENEQKEVPYIGG